MDFKILLVLFSFITLDAFSVQNTPIDGDKVTLSYMEVKDDVIKFAATDVHQMILRKNKGFLWPATKMVLSKVDGKLYFDVTAIDNSWCNIFVASEKPYGYFVVGGRMFIACSKGDTPIDMSEYFTIDGEIERSFYKPDATVKPIAKNPVWHYLHKGTMATVLDSFNMTNLGR